MIVVYRISKTKYISDLNGTGAKLFGGRWNTKGNGILYTAENIALCALETLVHISTSTLQDFSIATIQIPDEASVETLESDQLPNNWDKYPAPAILAQVGDRWLQSNLSLLLRVPSVIVPQEFNVLVNPLHPEFSRVNLANVEPFVFDERLLS